MNGRGHSRSLVRRYWVIGAFLATAPLLTLGGLELVLSIAENAARSADQQRAELTAAYERIGSELRSVEVAARDTAKIPWNVGRIDRIRQRDEFYRLHKLVASIGDVIAVSPDGMETVAVSRPDQFRIESGISMSGDPRLLLLAKGDTAWSRPHFKEGSDPYSWLAIRGYERRADSTIVEVKLKFIRDVATTSRVGRAGQVILVDEGGRLIGHPEWSRVLKQTDIAREPLHVDVTRSLAGVKLGAPISVQTVGLDGEPVLASAVRLGSPAWTLILSQPRREAYASVWASASRLIIMVIATLLLAFIVSRWLAGRLAEPILLIKETTDRFGEGQLNQRIRVDSNDEVGELAAAFNRMAGQIQETTEALERKVVERTAQFEEANRHKSEFLANMSHELRTPLNAIIGMSSALRDPRYGFGSLEPKQLEYIGDIHSSGQHLLSMINEILDMAKVEAGRLQLEPAEFDVATALRAALMLVRDRAESSGVRLVERIGPEVGTWVADPKRFMQILTNLLTNAVKFTDAGRDVVLAAQQTEDMLIVEVTDEGIGIAPEDQATIFEEFRQVGGDGRPRLEGTGLGLALTRRFVELHGGTICVASALGKGSTFTVRLPRIRTEA